MQSLPADQPPRDVHDPGNQANLGPSFEWADEPREPGFDGLTLRGEFPPPQEPPVRRQTAAWITLAGILAASAFAGYHYWTARGRTAQPAAPPAASAPATPAPVAPPATTTRLGGDVPPIDLPPLDQSDGAIATLVKALSSHPRVTAWLATKGLIRNFTVVVENIAAGKTPALHLQPLSPSGAFVTGGAGDRLVIDPRSYRRYDALAAGVASVDPAAAARLYGGLRPRIDEAYRDLGQDTSFDAVLERAIVLLLETPIPDPPVRLSRPVKGIVYPFADPRLEGLTAAQKQLVRMGPDNARTIQASLRSIALALGIPAERLPNK
jgi:hypothetical protein